jgi:iron-sulfur cluster insertion protein
MAEQTTQTAPIQVTEAAIAKVKLFAGQNDEYRGKTFRVFVEGGGCSGFQYGFAFDDRREGDQCFDVGGLDVLIDPMSLQYLAGSTVDFVEDLRGAGFTVTNPNAKTSCGCGQSFNA